MIELVWGHVRWIWMILMVKILHIHMTQQEDVSNHAQMDTTLIGNKENVGQHQNSVPLVGVMTGTIVVLLSVMVIHTIPTATMLLRNVKLDALMVHGLIIILE